MYHQKKSNRLNQQGGFSISNTHLFAKSIRRAKLFVQNHKSVEMFSDQLIHHSYLINNPESL